MRRSWVATGKPLGESAMATAVVNLPLETVAMVLMAFGISRCRDQVVQRLRNLRNARHMEMGRLK